MSNKLLNLSCIVLLFIVSSSCNKDSDDPCSIKVENINGSYKLENVKYKVTSSAPEIDYLDEFVEFKECAKDDILNFKSNGEFTTTDSGIPCNPPTNETTNWRINGNKIIIEIDEEYILEKLDCEKKKLILKYKDYEEDGDEIRIFLKKQ